MESEVYVLRHVDAAKVLAVLPSLRTYVAGGDGNLLTITAPPLELERIKTLLRQLDTPSKQVEAKVVVTEVSTQAARELGNTLLRYVPDEGTEFADINLPPRSFEFDGVGNLLTINADVYGTLLTRLKLLQEQREAEIHADPTGTGGRWYGSAFSGEEQILLIRSEDSVTDRVERIEVGVSSMSPRKWLARMKLSCGCPRR